MLEWPLWGLFASAFLSSTLLPGGSELALIALANQQDYSHLQLISIATFGNTLGGLTCWLIGYFIPTLNKQDSLAVERLQHYGSPILLLSWLPIIGDPLCVAAGWLRINLIYCLCFIALGKLSRYLVLIYLLG